MRLHVNVLIVARVRVVGDGKQEAGGEPRSNCTQHINSRVGVHAYYYFQ
jgi:hypothetical protein